MLFNIDSPLSEEDRHALYDTLGSVQSEAWFFLGAAAICLTVGVFFRPRKAALIALPFLLLALLLASFKE